ncbi:4818_t:CDS:2 [Scutellospora calospora]|uniref:4818_t:CDS:1 n=1 Tax=Scutellospora calospora TaxID=85575 RepID=A0ACA9K9F5_9GLOM|nr:4818_t:CDS:2 [Scutellospora calospora]
MRGGRKQQQQQPFRKPLVLPVIIRRVIRKVIRRVIRRTIRRTLCRTLGRENCVEILGTLMKLANINCTPHSYNEEKNIDEDEMYPREKTDEKFVNPNKSELPKITVKISQLSLNDSASDHSDDIITPKTPERMITSPTEDSSLLINLDEPQTTPKQVEYKISEDIFSLDWEKYQYSIFANESRSSRQNAPQPTRCKLPASLADFDSL